MQKTMTDGIVRVSQDVFWKKSGESFPVDYSCSPIYENNQIAGCVVMFQDITERKRLEKRVEQATRVTSLGRVAATNAPEFNNVLMGIQPFAEAIRRNATAGEQVQKAATQIISSVARGKRVTQEILRFTQPSEPAFQPVVLADWLQQLAPELRAMIGQRVTIDMETPPRPVVARCDPTQLQQVLTNLVLNARDAMPNGGTITLITADSGHQRQFSVGRIADGMVLLAVRDTGSGMLPKVRESIFEPLFTTKRSGTGLGLAVAQQIIERHGGSIHVDTAPGEGTTFFLLLPAAEQAAVQQGGKRASSTSVRRVLLVEDEPAVAAGIIALLEGEGIEVRAVERGAEAPDAAESFRPDAVILDLSLPDISGLDVYVSLKAIAPDLPIIFSGGHADQAALEQQIDSSTVAFLRKPYELEALLETLQTVVARRLPGVKW
jgi:nitrogen-specific signal transduction histidine kinase/ActR/RegA family two-component response regulator